MLTEVHFPDAIVIGLRIDHTGGVILTLHLHRGSIHDYSLLPFLFVYNLIY